MPACALPGSEIRLDQVVDEARDSITTFELNVCGFDVTGRSPRSALTPRGLTSKLRAFLRIPDRLGIASPEPWMVDGQEFGADTAEQALLLWALWGDEDLDKILRRAGAPSVAKVVPQGRLLADARKFRKRVLDVAAPGD